MACDFILRVDLTGCEEVRQELRMNRPMDWIRVGLAASLCLALAACAAGPKVPASDAQRADGAATVAAVPVASTPAAATATSPEAAAPQAAFKPPPGFKARKRKGEIVYCRTVVVTGSQFPQEQCWPPEQLQAALEKQKESSQRLLRQQRGCRGSECVSAPPTR
jgi:hypothetical protein